MILMRILIYGAGVIGEKSMKNEEYKKLSIKEFTKAAGRYESSYAGIYETVSYTHLTLPTILLV